MPSLGSGWELLDFGGLPPGIEGMLRMGKDQLLEIASRILWPTRPPTLALG